MNTQNERKRASHIRRLGESASEDVFPELAEFAKSESPLLRRLAASAIGKLAGISDSSASVDLLRPMLNDEHPQVRQYSAKALGAFGKSSVCALDDLHKMLRKNRKISVVILSHNKIDYTKMCIRSLLASEYPDWELVIVDNGSDDGTVQWLKTFRREAEENGVGIKLIFNQGNIGCSTARNQGIEASDGELVAFCDNDIALRSRDWLMTMAGELKKKDIAMVAPKIIFPFEPFNIQCAGAGVTKNGRVVFLGRGENRNDMKYNNRRELQCLISACCMTKKSILEEVGGFDEVFNPVEYEDIDLCYKIRALGCRIIYNPAVEMYHFENVTTEGTPALSNTYLIVKHSLIFREKWRYMYEKENGPSEKEAVWRKLPTCRLEDIGSLPII